MARLSINLLGSFNVTLDGQEVRGFDSDKGRALLAYLALESERPLRRERLAGLLWPEQTEEHARGSLSQAVYNLRKTLQEKDAPQPLLVTTHQSVQFNPSCDCQVDVRLFDDLLDACQRHPHPRLESCAECAARLMEATDLYRGDFLAGFSLTETVEFDEWLLLRRERLRQKALQALVGLVAYHESSGEIALALEHAYRIVDLDALWEVGQRSLIRLLAISGQRDSALSQYQSFSRLLEDELGVEPEAETQGLYQRLLREAGGQAALDNLPAVLTPFIGRQGELAELGNLLSDPDVRLVTVLGPGGCGKTRLALQVAQRLRYDYPEGVYLVPFTSLISSERLPAAVAEALGFNFREGADPQKQLKDYLHQKRVLLILDGFETILYGAGWLSELLRAAPYVKALVTSRARLNLKGEYVFTLGGMGYPGPGSSVESSDNLLQYSAVQLFVAGAQRKGSDLAWQDEDWREVGRICRMVGGMPLGVLLAAAWVDVYTPAEIAAEIETGLDILSADWQDAPERQRSLRATLDYSWGLLNLQEQELYCKLSIFQGGFTRQAARDVYGASPLVLQALVDKSMLEMHYPGRYGLHELLRQYAREKLTETPQVERDARQAHADYFLGVLPDWEAALKSSRQMEILGVMDTEHENLRTAWEWAVVSGKVDLFSRGLGGLCRYYRLRGRDAEGEIASCLAAQQLAELDDPASTRERIQATLWQYDFCNRQGDKQGARQLLEQSHLLLQAAPENLDLRQEWSRYWSCQSWSLFSRDLDASRAAVERSLELSLALDDPYERAISWNDMGNWLRYCGDFPAAEQAHRQSLELLGRNGAPSDAAAGLRGLGYCNMRQGKFNEALRNMLEAADLSGLLGDRHHQASALQSVGMIYVWLWRPEQARELMVDSQAISEELGDLGMANFCRMLLAYLDLNSGDYAQAETVLQDTAAIGDEWGSRRVSAFSRMCLGQIALARREYPQAERMLQESIDLYQRGAFRDELGFALGIGGMAACWLGNRHQAVERLSQGLRVSLEGHGVGSLHHCLAAAALLFALEEQAPRAVMLYAQACRLPALNHTPWVEDAVGWRIQEVADSLPEDVRLTAEARGQESDPFAAAAELLEWLEELAPSSREG